MVQEYRQGKRNGKEQRFDPKSGKQITLDKKRIYNIKSCSLKAGMYRMELERVR